MSKKNITALCFIIATLMTIGAANAATSISSASVTIGGGAFQPSNNVKISVDTTASLYAAYSGHLNGDRTLFTNNSNPKIYYGARTAGTNFTNDATASETVPTSFSSL